MQMIHMYQKATYWAPDLSVARSVSSQIALQVPAIRDVRWERTVQMIDGIDQEFRTEAKVFCWFPFDEEGYLYFGISSQAHPSNEPQARVIRKTEAIPDLKAERELFIAWL